MNMRRWDIKMKHQIGNRYLEMVFDDKKGQLISLVNKATGDNYLKKFLDYPVYKLYCLSLQDNIKREVIPAGVKQAIVIKKEDGQLLTIEFQGGLAEEEAVNIDVKAQIKVQNNNQETFWSIEVQNNTEDYRVVEILFPCLKGIYLGKEWQDDVIIYPHHAGEKTLAPIKKYTSERYLNFFRAETVKDGSIFFREINYCGLASMSWLYYYDQDNGFYISSYDHDFPVTGLRLETGGSDNPWMGFAIRKYISISPGEIWISHPYSVAITTEDWHWGAHRYRKWIDNYIDPPQYPDYLNDEYILNQCYNFKRDGIIYKRFKDIPSMYEEGRTSFEMRHMFIASWNRMGFDQNYPEYHPDMELGTPWELAEGCRYVNEHGGFLTFYINSRLFDIYSDYFENLGRRWAIKDENNDLVYEQYGDHKFAVLCPSHTIWQNYLMDIACWMVKSYGINGIYLDQLGSAEPFPCYDKSHSHLDIGQFNQGYLSLLKVLLPKIKALNPDSFLMIENCGDIYGSYVWGNLTWNGCCYDEFFNLYKYTFPEYIQVNMVNPPKNLVGSLREKEFHKKIARAMLLGSVFWVGMDKFSEEDQGLMAYLKKAVNMRKELNPLFKKGRYIDDEDILYMSKGIDISHWRLIDGRDLYVVANLKRIADAYFEVIKQGKKNIEATFVDIENNRGKAAYNDLKEKIQFYLPETELSYILLDRGE